MANALETIRPLFDTGTLPGLGPERRLEAKSLIEIESDLNTALATTGLTGESASLAQSTALLWHDHLDESHRGNNKISWHPIGHCPTGTYIIQASTKNLIETQKILFIK